MRRWLSSLTLRTGAMLAVSGAATLFAQDAAQPMDPTTPAPRGTVADLDRAVAEAETDALFAQAKLELIVARRALADEQWGVAAQKANLALEALRSLRGRIDVGEQELVAEGILARAHREGGINTDPIHLERGIDAATEIARGYDGVDKPEIDTRGNAKEIRARTLRQVPDRYGYRPGRSIFDVDRIDDREEARRAYQDALRDAYKDDEARLLVQVDEARTAPNGIVSYPDDWPEKAARRDARYPGGRIAKGASVTDADGTEWYVAVYDIHDLIYVPPDFVPVASMHPLENFRNFADRHAIRWQSQIFRGFPEDLAAGIPLLNYFGGIDPFQLRGPKYSLERQQQVIDMINAFTKRHPEAKVTPVVTNDAR